MKTIRLPRSHGPTFFVSTDGNADVIAAKGIEYAERGKRSAIVAGSGPGAQKLAQELVKEPRRKEDPLYQDVKGPEQK